jgi:hypothetical protein
MLKHPSQSDGPDFVSPLNPVTPIRSNLLPPARSTPGCVGTTIAYLIVLFLVICALFLGATAIGLCINAFKAVWL